MKYFQLRSGQTLIIRKAEKEDASSIINYINTICKESENLTFGEGEFGITADKEAEFIDGIDE